MAEVASSFVTIAPTFKGGAAAISKFFDGAASAAGKSAGGKMGDVFSKTLATSIDSKAAEKAVKGAADRLGKARDVEADAAGKVRVAEQKLTDLRESGKAKAGQLAAAEEALASATRKHYTAMLNTESAASTYASAQQRVKAALDGVPGEINSATTAMGRLSTAFKTGLDSGGLRSGIKSMFSAVPGEAREAGTEAGKRFTSGVTGGLDSIKSKFKGAFDDGKDDARRAGDDAGDAYGAGFGGKLKGAIGALGIAGLLAGIGTAAVAGIKESITAASDLQQSIGAIDAVFGASSEQVKKWASDASQSVGLSKNEFASLATVLGSSLKNKGIQDFAGETDKLIGLGADLAAQFGGPTSQAVEAISSLLRGESDPIEQYGISINETAVNAKLAEQGLDGLEGAALEQAKTQARLALLFGQSADAQGAFSRESGTYANSMQKLTSGFENVKAAIGTAFLPILTGAADKLTGFLPKVESFAGGLSDAMTILFTGDFSGEMFGGKFEEDSPFIDFLFTMREAAMGFVDGLKPIFAAIGPVIASLLPLFSPVFTIFKELAASGVFEQLINAIKPIFPVIQEVATVLTGALASAIQDIAANLLPIFIDAIDALLPVVLSLLPVFMQLVQAILPVLTTLLSAIVPIVAQFAATALPPLVSIVTLLVEAFAGFIPIIGDLVTALLPSLLTIFGSVVPMLGSIIAALTPVIELLINILAPTITFIGEIVAEIFAGIVAVISTAIAVISTIITGIADFLTSLFTDFGGTVSAIWGGISDFLTGLWQGISNFASSIWSGITDGVRGAMQSAWSVVQSIGSSIADTFSGIWQGIVNTASGILNTLKGAVSGAIDGAIAAGKAVINGGISIVNGIISGINLVIDGVNLLPGIEISHISKIPYMAEGGYVTSATLAVVGEGGPEIVAPEPKLKAIIRDELRDFTHDQSAGQSITINQYIDTATVPSDAELVDRAAELARLVVA